MCVQWRATVLLVLNKINEFIYHGSPPEEESVVINVKMIDSDEVVVENVQGS